MSCHGRCIAPFFPKGAIMVNILVTLSLLSIFICPLSIFFIGFTCVPLFIILHLFYFSLGKKLSQNGSILT